MTGRIRKMFPGGNTSEGFYSYYPFLLDKGTNRTFVIKGGPGVGKSTLMKKVGKKMVEQGYDVEFHYCSSDSNSVDGIAIEQLGIVMVDGTAPHIIDPQYPGGLDEIINLGEFWDLDNMQNNREKIIAKLSKRLKQSPVGIPGTEMALFHAATSGIKFPIFCIIDLEQPVTILGMDRQEMNLQRVLLMLAPKELTATESQLLGKISGSIIMNDLYTEIFRSGNQAIVYQLLSSLLVEEMKA